MRFARSTQGHPPCRAAHEIQHPHGKYCGALCSGAITRPGASRGRAEARQELARYPTVSIKVARVTDIRPGDGGFEYDCADCTAGSASTILLATGLVDELPEVTDIEAFYGVSVHHCLYCDGFEYAGKRVAAYGIQGRGSRHHDEALDSGCCRVQRRYRSQRGGGAKAEATRNTCGANPSGLLKAKAAN
jgi:hypothetical protein